MGNRLEFVGMGGDTMGRNCFPLIIGFCFGLACAGTSADAPPASSQRSADARFLLPGDSRTFAVHYVGRVPGVPAGTKRLRVWIPVPRDSTAQSIRELAFSQPPQIATEPKYGNKIAGWEISDPAPTNEFRMDFVCTRREIRSDLAQLEEDGTDPAGSFDLFRQPEQLVVVDADIRRLAGEITSGKSGTLEESRAIYDYVLAHMKYDKSQPGWGTGSTRFACQFGKGNCTDFHALFLSLCRAQGIAGRFEIGLYLPYERGSSEQLGGYHCWALFRVPGKTWVPVDCSEASRNPGRKDYFFGGHTSNRVALSTGRDLVLEPRQNGPPLNYFVNPYAEADGRPVITEKTWSYRDLGRLPSGDNTPVAPAK